MTKIRLAEQLARQVTNILILKIIRTFVMKSHSSMLDLRFFVFISPFKMTNYE